VCRMVKVFFPSAAATTERARDSRRDGVSLPTRSCCCVVFIVVSFQWWLGFHGRKQQHCCRHGDRSYSSSHSSAFRNLTNMSNSPPAALLADRIHAGTKSISTGLTVPLAILLVRTGYCLGLVDRSRVTGYPEVCQGSTDKTGRAAILTCYGSSSERSSHFHMIMMADNPTIISAQMKET
jgi:hypothetical protein